MTKESTLVPTEKMSNLMLNEGKVMKDLVTKGEDRVEINMWYLDNELNNHMTEDQIKFKELDEKLIGNMTFGDESIVSIHDKGYIFFSARTMINVY